MRTLHELYLILWNEIKDKKHINSLCYSIIYIQNVECKITVKELELLFSHFRSQKPNENLHSEFLESKNWSGDTFWWNSKENDNPVNRKAFIQKMIEITK